MKKNITPYLFAAPAFLVLGYFSILPMLQTAYYSTLEYSFFGPHRFIGAANYVRLFTDPHFWATLLNSLLFLSVTPVLMVVSLTLALSVRNLLRGARIVRLMLFLPVVTPVVIAGIVWRWIFTEETGLLNHLLSLASVGPVRWLTEFPTNLVSAMLVTVWRGMGYYMMLFLAGLALVPREVEEAGILDGATPLQQVWHVLLPMLRPTLLFVAVVSSSAAMKVFTEQYILIPGAPLDNKALVSFLYRHAFERFDFGYGSAAGMVLFGMTLLFSYTQVRLMDREQAS